MIFTLIAAGAVVRGANQILDAIHLLAQRKRDRQTLEKATVREAERRAAAGSDEPVLLLIGEPRPRLYGSVEEQQRASKGDTRAIAAAQQRFAEIEPDLEHCSRCGRVVTDPGEYYKRMQ